MNDRGPRGDTGPRGDQGLRGIGERGSQGSPGAPGQRGKAGRDTFNGRFDWAMRNALPLVAIVAVIFGYFVVNQRADDAALIVRGSQVHACEKVLNPNRRISNRNDLIAQQFMLDFSVLVRSLAQGRVGAERTKTLAIADNARDNARKIAPLKIPNCQTLFPKP